MKSSQPLLRNCWNSTLYMTFLVLFGNWITIQSIPNLPGAKELIHFRFAHMALGGLVFILLLILRNTRHWTMNISTFLFVALMAPFGFLTWQYHHFMVGADTPWIPLVGFRLYFLVLGILLSGRYAVNFILMSMFAIECLVLWYKLDLGNLPSVVLAQEPWISLVYFMVASALLSFRFRDEKLIQKLSEETANMAAMKQLARIFLSLRDRANTPIQTLKISAELLKRKYPDAKDLSVTIDATAKRLTEMNRYLGDVESAIPWGNKELISDAEVFQWIQKNSPPLK